MKLSARKLGMVAAAAAVAILSAAVLLHPIRPAFSQQPRLMDHAMPTHGQMPGMQHHGQQMMEMHGAKTARMSAAMPAMPGQDAFGTIQEIVGILEADPDTDWSNIDLESLRQHLIDMNEVTLRADAAATPIGGGLEIAVTGAGRTLAAIQRMVPAHARELDQINGWNANTVSIANGVVLTVTSSDETETAHIRGLGFIRLLASGAHHQPHHLAMAKGEFAH